MLLFKTILIPALLALLAVLFMLVSVGEKQFANKVLYASVAGFLFILLLVSTRL